MGNFRDEYRKMVKMFNLDAEKDAGFYKMCRERAKRTRCAAFFVFVVLVYFLLIWLLNTTLVNKKTKYY